MSAGYEPDFDIDLARGKQGEWLTEAMLRGDLKVEVKRDFRAMDTGNLYVETRCQLRDGWQPSGVMASKADVFAYVLREKPPLILLIGTDALRQLCETFRDRTLSQDDGNNPTEGIGVPLAAAVRSAKERAS